MFIVRALCFALALPLAACASELEPSDPSAPCDLDPEMGAAPRATGGIHTNKLAGNGIQVNGIQVNGIQTNRLSSNGIENTRVAGEGVRLNGFALNALTLNGISLNGVSLGGVATNGTMANELTGRAQDGHAIAGEAFVGATIPAVLSDGRTIDLTITGFERKPAHVDIAFYELAHEGQSICAEGAKGMFLPGAWDERGARHDSLTTGASTASVTFSCVGGVIAKCALWGYAPWRVGAALHQTCTRMARADYCGSGVSFTRDGTPIDMFDVSGVNQPANEAGFLFEAGWNENGATCVSRPRYDAVTTSGEAVLPSCFRDLPTCSSFDEAKQHGATLANASRPQTRRICR